MPARGVRLPKRRSVMSRIRGLAVFLLLALLAASAAQALPTRPGTAAPEPAGIFAPLWNWLAGLMAAPGGAPSAVSVKSAAIPDPDPAGEDLDATGPDGKPTKDPKGTRLPNPGDAGGEMDPNG